MEKAIEVTVTQDTPEGKVMRPTGQKIETRTEERVRGLYTHTYRDPLSVYDTAGRGQGRGNVPHVFLLRS